MSSCTAGLYKNLYVHIYKEYIVCMFLSMQTHKYSTYSTVRNVFMRDVFVFIFQ